MVSKELLQVLICPACRGDLNYDAEKETLTCAGRHCPECGMAVDETGLCSSSLCGKQSSQAVGMRYRVDQGIPVMLIDEAEKIAL
jgi:uncharacterized protein YbaR (Trm112 family)